MSRCGFYITRRQKMEKKFQNIKLNLMKIIFQINKYLCLLKK